MSAHTKLHLGHIALLNYAKSFGEAHAPVYLDSRAIAHYIQTGQIIRTQNVNIHGMKKELDGLGVKSHYISLLKTCKNEKNRLRAYEEALRVTNLYKDILLTPILQQQALTMMASRLMIKLSGNLEERAAAEIRGPYITNFVLKEIYKRVKSPLRVEIFPQIIMDRTTGLNYQSSIEKYPWLPRVGQAILGARERFKIGRNEELVKELNSAYQHRPWKWYEIIVWEGGLVPGKLELVQINTVDESGLKLLGMQSYETN